MKHADSPQAPTSFKGVPLTILFSEELSEATVNRWVDLAFEKGNQFGLWGQPIRLGPTKVHVYGVDRQCWVPINLEMTSKRLVAILPKGTRGDTFQRLISNVQRFLCPNVKVWLGPTPIEYSENESQTDPATRQNALLQIAKIEKPANSVKLEE